MKRCFNQKQIQVNDQFEVIRFELPADEEKWGNANWIGSCETLFCITDSGSLDEETVEFGSQTSMAGQVDRNHWDTGLQCLVEACFVLGIGIITGIHTQKFMYFEEFSRHTSAGNSSNLSQSSFVMEILATCLVQTLLLPAIDVYTGPTGWIRER